MGMPSGDGRRLAFLKTSTRSCVPPIHLPFLVFVRDLGVDDALDPVAAADLPILEKIGSAHALERLCKEALLVEPRIQDLLDALALGIKRSRQVMVSRGVVAECRWCEEEAGGSCCGAGIENRYTVHLLLINLLMGVTLPEGRRWPDSCYFLGSGGCVLKARHVLCVNYLCERLQRKLSAEAISELQACCGTELETGFALHEAIKKITRP